MIQIHQIKPSHKKKKKKRVGRGGKRGTYSGGGVKGQKSRAGRKLKPIIRELIKKYPKLRGYRIKLKRGAVKAEINIATIEKNFNSGDLISPQVLIKKGLINKIKGRVPRVKILGKKKTNKKFIIKGCEMSKNVEEKIKKAGGIVKIKD